MPGALIKNTASAAKTGTRFRKNESIGMIRVSLYEIPIYYGSVQCGLSGARDGVSDRR